MADRYSIALNKVPEVTLIRPGICLTFELYYQNILLRPEEVTINFRTWRSQSQDIALPKMDIMIDKIVCKFRGTVIVRKEFPPMTIASDLSIYYRMPSLKEFWDGFPLLKNLEQT